LRTILGIDPGLRVTGYGVIYQEKQNFQYTTSGAIRTTKQDLALAVRIKSIVDGITEVIDKFKPSVVAIEKVFVNTNPQSTLLLGQARGAAIAAIVAKEINIYEYTALQIKKSVVGNGHADKIQVQTMVQRLLKLPSLPGPDSADALACAICHANISDSLGRLGVGNRMKSGRII
jgi:crossover junction endodeoxyribonuclease RuvC